MRFYYRLVFWSILWAILWPVMLLFKKRSYENCATWAMKRWEQQPDGYIVIRWSRSNKYPWLRWPHFLFIEPHHHDKMVHLLPKDATQIEKHLIPAIWFDGEITNGDAKKQGYEN